MNGDGSATFRRFAREISEVLESKELSYDVANSLYQSEGLVSLESVNDIREMVHQKDKVVLLMGLLQTLIDEDRSRFNLVVQGMMEYSDLKPIMEKMTWKNIKFITEIFKKVPFQANHSLGIELDVPVDFISRLETDHRGDSLRIRRELIRYWINNAQANVTLKYLKAVAKKLAPSVKPSLRKFCLCMTICLVFLIVILVTAALLAPSMASNIEGPSVDSKLSAIPTLRQLVHQVIQRITGTNIYIKSLPIKRKKMFGREEKLNKIIHHVVTENSNVMVLGPPGFGKSMLAIHAGHNLSKEEDFDVSYVDATEHFSMSSTLSAINQFYGIIAGWCNERTRKTVLILDNFDVLLADKSKKQLFQNHFLPEIETAHNVSIIVTTHKETLNDNFGIVRATELPREASMELLASSKIKMSNEQRNKTAELIEDCPLALHVVLNLIVLAESRNKSRPVDDVINKLNESKIEGKLINELYDQGLKDEYNYNYIMKIAFDQLKEQPQCCGRCISNYPGSFSDDLFPITENRYGVPCNDSTFKDCVDDLVHNSLVDLFSYEDDEKWRFKMHALIQSYFYQESKDFRHTCEKSYRLMFSLLFSEQCALSYNYTERDLNNANKILTSEYHHFRRLLSYIFRTKSLNKYEGAVLMIAHQRGEIPSKHGYKILFEAVCKNKENAEYSKSLMGVEAFGSIVRNVSEEIYDFNFLRCEFMTDNFCSKELLNSPLNSTSRDHLSSSDVRTVVCTCFLMNHFHIMGTLSVLGALPLLYVLTLVKLIPMRVKVDKSMIIFIYMSFLPSILKLYYKTEFQRMLYNIGNSPLLYLMFSQLLYEGVLIMVMGHMLQQREVFYRANANAVKVRNIVMLLTYFCLAIALLYSDMLGMYSWEAVKFSLAIIIGLLSARYVLFDFVMKKISSGIFLRFFLRFILGLLSLSSSFLCQRYYFETSFIIQSIFWIVFVIGLVDFCGLTIPLFYHLNILTFEYN